MHGGGLGLTFLHFLIIISPPNYTLRNIPRKKYVYGILYGYFLENLTDKISDITRGNLDTTPKQWIHKIPIIFGGEVFPPPACFVGGGVMPLYIVCFAFYPN